MVCTGGWRWYERGDDDIMVDLFVNGRLREFDHRLEPGDVVDIHI